MKIGGHGLRDHLRLLAPLFGLIAAVWALRMILDYAGVPLSVVRVFSVSLADALSMLLAVVLVHQKKFGSYSNLIFAVFLLNLWAQLLIVLAMAFSMLTGVQTIYNAPEFSAHMTPWHHLLGHLTFGVGVTTLFGAAMTCLLLWLLRKVVSAFPPEDSSA